MKNNPVIPKIYHTPVEQHESEDDFDFGSYLGCDDHASEEEIDQAWENQMC